jgi:hypothetical protein
MEIAANELTWADDTPSPLRGWPKFRSRKKDQIERNRRKT